MYIFFFTILKKGLPMLTMVGGCSQDNIIYKCTKLHDHSSNRIYIYSLCAAHAIFLDVQGEAHPP